ncbi:hypothetical protein KAR29_08035 [Aminithiophilus ramosus]|uniref:Cell division protein ZapA n=2 Tax=Synergistales TaxID=649776 RepID=A0A9Q7ALQ8_9BACT|nr:hypothetical protein [Aminithiophilus ramosus]QTX31337.1 hypothetical protein KAR29_08035 [Aminithiophilus ramosus]QVL35136.1 hypothetical protein KIH16_07855 [Synergistota bacterium]
MTELPGAEMRRVRLRVGKKTYPIRTPLTDDELDRLLVPLNVVIEESGGPSVGQEERLLLALLRYGWQLERIRHRLEALLKEESR